MYKKSIDVDEVVQFCLPLTQETKIYIGCDSERLNINDSWYADYITAVVIHINGNNGCKIFGAVERERDYDQKTNKPRMRLMNEVYRVADLYLKLVNHLQFDIEVHLDINPKEMYNSNIVIHEAIGYIKGMCGVIPFVKPRAFAASCAADRYKEIVGNRLIV